MASDPEEQLLDEPLQVTFFPPLYLQRRIWVLDILRRENVTSVLDIGCGEGQLLSVLAQPAFYLLPPQATETTTPISPTNAYKDEFTNLHCTHVFGLDVSTPDLEFAVESTAPPPPDGRDVRWEPLEVNIWKGGLEAINRDFMGIECIVSTEVCEHLPEDVLVDYAPMILGVYQPRLFLMTTPSYTFNARFSPPGKDRTGYTDPTGRTTRMFRHHDHKFEWTVEEFTQWCEAAAQEWGYAVQIGSVGKAQETDEWGRDDELGGASQVAEFTRLEDKDSAAKRAKGRDVVLEKGTQKEKHELLVTHRHLAHPSSRNPASLEEIANAVKAKMIEFREVFLRVEELWVERDISLLCGGWLELLIQAIEGDERFDVYKGEAKTRCSWRVELKASPDLQQEMETWQPESVGDVSIDPFESWDGSSTDDEEIVSDTERGEGSERDKDDEGNERELQERGDADDMPWGIGQGWGTDKIEERGEYSWFTVDRGIGDGQKGTDKGWSNDTDEHVSS